MITSYGHTIKEYQSSQEHELNHKNLTPINLFEGGFGGLYGVTGERKQAVIRKYYERYQKSNNLKIK
jgi:hypothetical protein